MCDRFGVKGTGIRDEATGNRQQENERGEENAAFIAPLEVPYSLLMEMGVFWIHGAFRGPGAFLGGAQHAEGGMKVRCRETCN
jgi:hypothetical protein